MQDLTTGSLSRHLLKTSSFMLIAMVFQTLYVLIDLYWVARLGTGAVAAVAVSGNLAFLVLAATQTLGVGTTTVVSHAVGRKEHGTARLVFNQSLGLAATLGVAFFIIAMLLRMPYAASLSADVETASLAGRVPGLVRSGARAAIPARRDGRRHARNRQLQAGDDRPERDDHHQHHPGADLDLRVDFWRAPRRGRRGAGDAHRDSRQATSGCRCTSCGNTRTSRFRPRRCHRSGISG
jgi:hypothetical protein